MKNKPLKLVYRITRSLRYRILKRIPFVQDITNMIFIMEKKDQIKILRLNMQRPDTDYLSSGIYTWNIQWKKGVLTDLADGKELLYFHFLKSKNREFDVSSANPGDDFTITQKGIGY